MYTWSKRLRLSQTERSPRATHRAPLGKRPISWLGAVFFMPLLLAGCVDRAVSGGLNPQQQEAIPDTKVIDYRTAACDTLWQLDDKDALDNALYWLRAMDCADRIGSTCARAGENGAWRQLVRRFQTEHPAGQRTADLRRTPPDHRQDQQLSDGISRFTASADAAVAPAAIAADHAVR